jgi:hypothetical protein
MARLLAVNPESKKGPPPVKDYVLHHGKHVGADRDGNRVLYDPGDIVPLTEAQYASFKDKFIDEARAKAFTEATKAAGEGLPENEPARNPQIPGLTPGVSTSLPPGPLGSMQAAGERPSNQGMAPEADSALAQRPSDEADARADVPTENPDAMAVQTQPVAPPTPPGVASASAPASPRPAQSTSSTASASAAAAAAKKAEDDAKAKK